MAIAKKIDRPLVVATVGSERFAFDRLIVWLDDWLSTGVNCEVVCQHGSSRAPRSGTAVDFMPYEDMQRLLGAATLVVCHGGAGTVMECLRLGRRPIVVPRLKALGEAVDNHQLDFCRLLAENGDVVMAESKCALIRAVTQGLALPSQFAHYRASLEVDRAASVNRFAAAITAASSRQRADNKLTQSARGAVRRVLGSREVG